MGTVVIHDIWRWSFSIDKLLMSMLKFNGKCSVILATSISMIIMLGWFTSRNDLAEKNAVPKIATHIKALESSQKGKRGKEKTKAKRGHPFVFVRTHKTGSSTIADVVMRYAIAKEASLQSAALFPWPFIGGYPGRIRFKFIKPEGDVVGALWQHQRFDADELHRHMPKGTRYFTVIREPWSHFQSTYNYYGHSYPKSKRKAWNCIHMPIAYVLKRRTMNPVDFMHECTRSINKSVPWYFRLKNYQAHDLGFDSTLEDQVKIERQLKALDKNMDLVMISEYMKESLILLKNLLNLDWSDIVFYRKNVMKYKKFDLTTEEDRLAFAKHSKIDTALYRRFNDTFWRKVDSYGRQRIEEDLRKFNGLLKKAQSQSRKRKTFGSPKMPKKIDDISRELNNYMFKNNGDCPFPDT